VLQQLLPTATYQIVFIDSTCVMLYVRVLFYKRNFLLMNVSLDCCHANLTESSRVDSSLTHKLKMETPRLTRLYSIRLLCKYP